MSSTGVPSSPRLNVADATGLIKRALVVATEAEFSALRAELDAAGASYGRPVGDQYGNLTTISATGNPEYLVLEPVTNMQDGVLERAAAALRLQGLPVPTSPRELAAVMAWPSMDPEVSRALGEQATLTFRDSGELTRPTISSRDKGIGIPATEVRNTVLSLAQAPKDRKPYLLGNYGKGGSTMFRDDRGAILVGRPSPELCAESGCPDMVWITTVTAVDPGGKNRRWEYQVTSEFDRDRPADTGFVLAFPAQGIDFEPGVAVIHVSYGAPDLGRHRAQVDNRSLYAVGNTRLFHPVLPWLFVDDRVERAGTEPERRSFMYGRRAHFMGGSPRQLRGSPHEATVAVADPESGAAWELPITVFLFEKGNTRRSATARDHVVVFTVNGQVQNHWGHVTTRNRTADASETISGLRRVAEQVLFAEVNLDPLPAQMRSMVIAGDRTQFTDVPLARAIEAEVAQWLMEQPLLIELEKELSREAARSSTSGSVNSKLLDEIARKLGFTGPVGPPPSPPPPPPPPVLLPEPTELVGRTKVTVVAGTRKSLHFSCNAVDRFIPDRGAEVSLVVEGVTLATEPRPSTLTGGRFSMDLLTRSDTECGVHLATLSVSWLAAAGGVKTLQHVFKLDVLATRPDPPPPSDRRGGVRPVVRWDTHEPGVVGEVNDDLTGNDLYELWPEEQYKDIGDRRVTLITVNVDFSELRRYVQTVANSSGDQTVAKRKDRYLVGTAVGLAQLYGVRPGSGDPLGDIDDEVRKCVAQLMARSVVASLPPAQD